MEEKTIKIINKLEVTKDNPFMWEVEIHDGVESYNTQITSWDKQDLKEGLMYKIKLLDETGNDAANNMRRISKGSIPELTDKKDVEEGTPKDESTEVPEETPDLVQTPKKEIKWNKIDLPKKEDKPVDTKIQDEFDEEFGHMIDQEVKEETKSMTNIKSTQSLVIPKGNELEVSLENIKKYLFVPNVTDSEYYLYYQLCINQSLNPFIGDVYLVKYGTKAQMIVSKDAFLKKAELTKGYLGFEAGIVVVIKGSKEILIERIEGSLKIPKSEIIGGWARVHRKDMQPFYAEVSFEEYDAKKAMWKTKPATMIRKVALVQCLREAFPSSFQGMYDGAEIDTEAK